MDPADDSDTDTARELIAASDATIEFFRSLLGACPTLGNTKVSCAHIRLRINDFNSVNMISSSHISQFRQCRTGS